MPDKRGGLVVRCKSPRNCHRIRNPSIFTLISPSIQDRCLFSYLSFSTNYFSTPPGVCQNKKSPSHFQNKTTTKAEEESGIGRRPLFGARRGKIRKETPVLDTWRD